MSKEVTLSFRLTQNCEFQHIIAQLQKQENVILCVIDGVRVVWFTDINEIPDTLMFEHKQKINSLWEYYYRCSLSQSTYIFFLEQIHDKLKEMESTKCLGKIINLTQ